MSRQRAIGKIKAALLTKGYPRLQMLLLVGLTGGAGFLTSYFSLQQGLETIWPRYLLAMAVAYLAFLALLGLWVKSGWKDWVDGADMVNHLAPPPGGGRTVHGEGQGGGSSWDLDLGVPDLGDGWGLVLMVVGLVAAILLSSLWLVWSAPTLFAELLLDAGLAAGLYQRLKKLPQSHWLDTAIRGTIWPFVLTTLVVVGVGWGINQYLPEAQSLGDVLAALKSAE
jgi:hypothetical protein